MKVFIFTNSEALPDPQTKVVLPLIQSISRVVYHLYFIEGIELLIFLFCSIDSISDGPLSIGFIVKPFGPINHKIISQNPWL